MSNGRINRRLSLATAVVVPMPGLLHRQVGSEVFTLPIHAWRALASTATTTRRSVVIDQDVSAGSAGVMASLISDCPGGLGYYRDLYFGMFEPTPALDAGRLWFDDPKRLEGLCAFLRRGGFSIEEDNGWTVLIRRTL